VTTALSRRPRRGLALTISAATASLLLAACGSSDTKAGTTTADGITLVKPGQLTVCTHLPYKPFQYKEGSKVVGFDVDLLDGLAKELGVKQEIFDIEFQQIWSGAAFAAKKCDLGAAGMTITDKRKQTIAFSAPYFDATQALIVKAGSPYKDLPDLKGKKVGVQTETTGLDYANSKAKELGYTVVVFDDLALEMNAVKSGRVDAAINDNGVVLDFAKTNKDTSVVKEFSTGEQYGVGAKKDDANATKLLAKLNASLAKAKSDGSYNAMYKKWFGTEPGKLGS
jgi:polar amino acid transport system substrate-binding protein